VAKKYEVLVSERMYRTGLVVLADDEDGAHAEAVKMAEEFPELFYDICQWGFGDDDFETYYVQEVDSG